MATNWDDFTPINQPDSAINWDDFTPVDSPVPRTAANIARDIGVTALKGAVGLPQALVGIVDIPAGGRVGKALESVGVDFGRTQQILDKAYSEPQQAANRAVREAEGFMPTVQAALRNPSVIATSVGESLPQMLGGAAIARGILSVAPRVGAVLAGAAGEGAIGAGSAAAQIREDSSDRLLSGRGQLAAVGSGLGTAALGAAGGTLARRLGVGDIDTMLAGGRTVSDKGFLRQLVGAGISEGVFEELPQSAQEQMWQNYATGRPLDEGVGNAAALGMLAGATMGGAGGGFNAATGAAQRRASQARGAQQEPDSAPAEASSSAGAPGARPEGQPTPDPTMRLAELDLAALSRDLSAAEQAEMERLAAQLEMADGATGDIPAGDPAGAGRADVDPAAGMGTGDRDAGAGQRPADVAVRDGSASLAPARDADAGSDGAVEVDPAEQALRQPMQLTALERVDAIDQDLADPKVDPAHAEQLRAERASITDTWPTAQTGSAARFSTEAGVQLEGRYALMEAEDLVTSHDEHLRANPLFPRELQPRDRSRAASEMQVQSIVGRLDPARLGVSADASTGAPIVGADGLVESGNARTIALKRVYRANGQKAANYRAWIEQAAEQFGLSPQQAAGMRNPVLVRVRVTPVNRAEFARQANAATVQRMSASEQALADAQRLSSLRALEPTEDGDFSASRDFIRQFMSALPLTEQAEMLEADGRLSTAGYRRIQNAVLAKAYGDSPTLRRMTESLDDNLRNISKALVRAAPAIAEARDRIRAGALHDADIAPALIEAVEALSNLKARGWKVEDELAQGGIEGPRDSDEATLLQMLDANIRRPSRIAEFLRTYYDALESFGDPNQGSLLGSTQAPQRGQLLDEARRRTSDGNDAQDAQRGVDREGPQPAAHGGRQPAHEARGGGGDQGDGAAGSAAAVQGQGRQASEGVAENPAGDTRGVGSFGPILTQYRGDAQGAIKALTEMRTGEAVAALNHPEVGDIDLVWGEPPSANKDGFGLAKIAEKHPEVLGDLQGFLSRLKKEPETSGMNRVRLTDDRGVAVVRLEWDGASKTWLLTAYERGAGDSTRTDTAALTAGGDTARPGTDSGPNVPEAQEPGNPPAFSRSRGAESDAAERQLKKTERAYGGRDTYDRLRAAGRTKLTFGQWVQVRTPAFKAWFGDWAKARAARVLQGKPVATLAGHDAPHGYPTLRQWAVKLFQDAGGKVTNPELGEVLLDERAVRASMGHGMNQFKAEAFAAVPQVLERGAVVVTGRANSIESHYVSAPVRIRGVDDVVTVLVRRDANAQRMYLHSVVTKEGLLRARDSGADAKASKERSGKVTSGDVASVLRDLLNFNPDSVSKVTDPETGEPLVMYHGSYRDLEGDAFDRMHSTKRRAVSMDTVGSWFSDNPSADGGAGMYATGDGARIYPVHLSIERPKVYDRFEDFLRDMHEAEGRDFERQNPKGIGSAEGLRAKLKAQGYDGIAFTRTNAAELRAEHDEFAKAVKDARNEEFMAPKAERAPYTAKRERLEGALARLRAEIRHFGESTEFDRQTVWVAFEPEQIKSATGNTGAFDSSNPDIRFSRAPAAARSAGLESIEEAWAAEGIESTLSERGGVITVSRIVVPPGHRGQGAGTRAMQQLVEFADAAGLHIALTPSADFGGNKARLKQFYRRFGFVENKGRNRVFTVSEAMVRISPNGPVMFSRSASTQQAYEARIDALFADEPANRVGAKVLDRADVLDMLGLGDGPVYLAEGKVREGRENHPRMTAEVWKKIPQWIEDPAAVFESDTVKGRVVFVAPESVDGAPVLVIIEPNVQADSAGLRVHIMVNAYDAAGGRTPFNRWLGEGMARYVDQKKFPAILAQAGLRLPSTALQNKPGTRKILTEKNLAGYRRAVMSRGAGSETGLSAPAVTRIANAIRAAWANGPEVVVVAEMADPSVPARVREYDAEQRSQGATGEPEGFFYGGKVYLVAGQLGTPADVVRVLAHEALGHYGLRGLFGSSLDGILDQIVMVRRAEIRAKLDEYGLPDTQAGRRQAAEEVLAVMAQTTPQLGFVRRAVAAIRTWLRGLGLNLQATDDEIIRDFILPAREFVERGGKADAGADPFFSRSAMKSTEANIRRGRAAMAKALTERADVHRAMFRNGIGWIDFVWGDAKRGLQHIRERRMAADGMTPTEVDRMLSERIVETIASGVETKRAEVGKALRVTVELNGTQAILVRRAGGNSWLLTGFETVPGGTARGATQSVPTQSAPTRSRRESGAGQDILADSTNPGNNPPPVFSRSTLGTNEAPELPPHQRNRWQFLKSRVMRLTDPQVLDKLVYEFQDKFIDLKRITDHIKALGGTVTDLNDAYLGEELYHKRLAKRSEDFLAQEVKPLLAQMRAAGVGMADLERYLHARHAPEANAAMAERNPTQAMIDARQQQLAADVRQLELDLQRAQSHGTATKAILEALEAARADQRQWGRAQAFRGTEDERLALSGMSDEQAQAIMDAIPAGRRQHFEALAARVDAINSKTLDTLQRYGLADRATLDAWRSAYQHYVPLHRDEAHAGSASHPIGQGFSVKGDAAKRRTGSTAEVTNILGHIVMQREAALTRGEKNAVAKRLYLLASQNPDRNLWSLEAPKRSYVDNETGLVVRGVDPLYKSKPNVLMLKLAGKDVAIVFNERNAQAMRVAEALKNLDVGDLHVVLGLTSKATRWFSSVNTQYNPVFGVINFIRDVQAGLLNLSTTPLAGKQREVGRDTVAAMRAIYRDVRGKAPKNTEWTRLWQQMQDDGGTTGYRDLFVDAEDRAKKLQKELASLDRGQVSEKAHAIVDWLSDYNETMENAVRLAAYKQALDAGMSRPRAASLAKNLTVNFNRKGRQTRELGALYAFFNAAVQGNARVFQALRGPTGRKIMLGGVMVGVVNTLLGMLFMGGGDDGDDNWEKIPEFIKERSIIVPLGREDYATIPMPLGFHVLPNIGRLAVEFALGGPEKGAGRQIGALLLTLVDAFDPLGGSGDLAQQVAPSVLDPVVALMQNKDWTGRQIYREDRNSLDPTPGHQRAKDSASTPSVIISKGLNWLTGGTDYRPGLLSWTPDQLDYVVGQLTGGLGREVLKASATVAAPFTGDELPAHKVPLLSRVYGNTRGPSGQSERYYENIRELNEIENELQGRAKAGQDVQAILRSEPLAQILGAGKAADKQIKALRDLRREVAREAAPGYQTQVRQINEQIGGVMGVLNKEARRARREAVE